MIKGQVYKLTFIKFIFRYYQRCFQSQEFRIKNLKGSSEFRIIILLQIKNI